MSISKSYNKNNGVTYVYDVYENYWDKDLGSLTLIFGL